MPSGRLYLVATPIGNLGDLSPRARDVLAHVDGVLAEDTRRTGQLLGRFAIGAKTLSLHEHNERARIEAILENIATGSRYALVSDAGTPAISDPGRLLVREARRKGIAIESVAGPSALAAALSASGFPAEPSVFLGFPPSQKGKRRAFLEPWRDTPATLVLFEAPHRIEASFADLADLFGAERPAILVREMTKLHEEAIDGTLGSIRDELLARGGVKGEIVVVIAPPESASVTRRPRPSAGEKPIVSDADLRARVAELQRDGTAKNEALKRAAREAGLSRSVAYRKLHTDERDDE